MLSLNESHSYVVSAWFSAPSIPLWENPSYPVFAAWDCSTWHELLYHDIMLQVLVTDFGRCGPELYDQGCHLLDYYSERWFDAVWTDHPAARGELVQALDLHQEPVASAFFLNSGQSRMAIAGTWLKPLEEGLDIIYRHSTLQIAVDHLLAAASRRVDDHLLRRPPLPGDDPPPSLEDGLRSFLRPPPED